jgi:dUTP pyrophosphatase
MLKTPVLQIQKLDPNAKLPTRGSEHAIGIDLYALDDVLVPYGDVARARTGIAVAIPNGYYGRIAPRSGLASKQGIDVLAGVIDADYRGELIVLLTHHSMSADIHRLKAGERIAQLILERADIPTMVVTDQLDETVRGSGGFGSSGK